MGKFEPLITRKRITSKLEDWKEDFLYTLKHTAIEVFIGAAVIGIPTGILSYEHQDDKNKIYRLGFSEIHRIEQMITRSHKEIPNMTDFLGKTNDYYMKILESHNESWRNSFFDYNTKAFAQELEYHKDMTFKQHYYEFPQLSTQVPKLADSLLLDLRDVVEMKNHVDMTLPVLDKTWDEYHHDETHIEVYTELETYTDSKGDIQTRVVVKTKTVYDYTDNKYDYHKESGLESARLLDQFRDDFPKITLDTLFVTAKETGAENEYAIEKSHKYDYENNKFPVEKYLEIANSWAKGSLTHQTLERIAHLQRELISDANSWDSNKNTAKSSFIRTYDESRPRPKELENIINAESDGEQLSSTVAQMIRTINYTKQHVPSLNKKIDDYISAVLDHNREDSEVKTMQKEIISETMKGYNVLFPNAIKLERAEWGYVWLFSILGLVAGGVAGGGVEYITTKTNFYDRFRKKKNKDD